ncbi:MULTISPECIES: peptidogalycan biosysnthesis protein [unclassified Streptomyces]|uniref:peptidogalycan biosysnthesis protein n=1 Tax=unclassified Streptomyces TaxID=2593676 RepID=UPI002365D412|nr:MULTISPECIES: peptidogalycan biosysnthesis protein [unclassified Streptomyces]MDF3143536.1 peptidogalycan biosysnthesis protein [Streptomyces sp. T21Q-yed]WDF43758.1 peptidogalycan biosysnthesis protein [Streptomyces sp. T12]
MKTEIVSSVDAVPVADWDRLAQHAGVYLSHRWLAGEEGDPTATASYALIRDHDGTLVAAAPLYLVHREPNTYYEPTHLPPGTQKPRVIAGARRGYHNTPLTAPHLPEDLDAHCLALLREAARDHAERHGTSHWWPYLTESATRRLAPLYGTPPHRLEDDATIPLPGDGFDDYLASLPSKRRVAIRHERAAFEAAGLDVRRQRLADCYEDAGRLLAALQKSHGHGDDTDAMTSLLRRQADAMGDLARVVAAYDGPLMTGFCLYYHQGSTTWLRAVGIDPERPAPFAYFALTYYAPIEDAYRHGTTAVHAGMKAIEAKRLRGARVSGLYALHDTRTGASPATTTSASYEMDPVRPGP